MRLIKSNYLLSMAFALLTSLQVHSQQVVKGKVEDPSGKPLPGVKVEVLGSEQFTITDLDGRFTIPSGESGQKVRLRCVGLQTKTLTTDEDMDITLKENRSVWSFMPEQWQFFAGVNVGFPDRGFQQPAIGIMAGAVKEWGVYVHGLLHLSPGISFYEHPLLLDFDGKRTTSFKALTVGGMRRLGCPLYLNVGVGVSQHRIASTYKAYDHSSAYVGKWSYKEDAALCVEAGLTLRLRQLLISGGSLYTATSDHAVFVPYCGIGYCF